MNIEQSTINETILNEQEKCQLLVLPYAGNKGEKIMKSVNKFITLTQMSEQLHLTAEILLFISFVYILAMVTSFFLDFTVHFDNEQG